MNYVAALQELYFNEYGTIGYRLGAAIINDNLSDLNALIQTYFSTPEARILLNGHIAYVPPEKKDGDGDLWVPAFLAMERSSLKSLKAIIQVTGNPNARANPDDPENTPTLIISASGRGNSDAVKLLLASGADVNSDVRSSSGLLVTALSQATSNGYTKLARLLVEAGAEITIVAALVAIESEATLSPILEYFIEQKPNLINEACHAEGFYARTLLHQACGQGNLSVVQWLVGKGADINAPDSEGHTPRDYANFQKHPAIEKYLASIGAVTKSETDVGIVSQQSQVNRVEKREITELVDRLELLEDKLGIRLEGIYAVCAGQAGQYAVEVNCDLIGTGATLEHSFSLRLNAYNTAGQLLKTETAFIHNEKFTGLQSCSLRMYCDQLPHRLRLFPSDPI
jgi:ankyrin repeat protein